VRDALAERALKDLVGVGVRERRQYLGPALAIDFAALGGGAHPAIPADLLHVIIELDAVAVGIESEGGVVDAGIKFGRDRVDQRAAALLQIGRASCRESVW